MKLPKLEARNGKTNAIRALDLKNPHSLSPLFHEIKFVAFRASYCFLVAFILSSFGGLSKLELLPIGYGRELYLSCCFGVSRLLRSSAKNSTPRSPASGPAPANRNSTKERRLASVMPIGRWRQFSFLQFVIVWNSFINFTPTSIQEAAKHHSGWETTEFFLYLCKRIRNYSSSVVNSLGLQFPLFFSSNILCARSVCTVSRDSGLFDLNWKISTVVQ